MKSLRSYHFVDHIHSRRAFRAILSVDGVIRSAVKAILGKSDSQMTRSGHLIWECLPLLLFENWCHSQHYPQNNRNTGPRYRYNDCFAYEG